METCTRTLVLISITLLLSLDFGSGKHICGKHLADLMSLICKHADSEGHLDFNVLNGHCSPDFGPSLLLLLKYFTYVDNRVEEDYPSVFLGGSHKALVHECCYSQCSLSTLQSYCSTWNKRRYEDSKEKETSLFYKVLSNVRRFGVFIMRTFSFMNQASPKFNKVPRHRDGGS